MLIGVILAWAALCSPAAPSGPDADSLEARRLAQELILVDTHIDLPGLLLSGWEDVSQRTSDGEFDYVRAREGGLDVAFMSVYIPSSLKAPGQARVRADTLIDLVEQMARRWPDKFALVSSPAEVRAQAGKGKVLLAMGMENGSPVENDLKSLEHFFRRGIRYITLAHAKSNQICDAAYDSLRPWNGLSPFGVSMVAEMNRLGIMVDISHLSDSAAAQVLRVSRAPVIASHSACRTFTPGWERNMDDAMIRDLAAKGGVLQMNFGSSFLRMDVRRSMKAEEAALGAYRSEHGKTRSGPAEAEFLRGYREVHPQQFADVTDIVRHIDHVVKLVGIDYVGLGSDFDGLDDELPVGLKDASMYPNLLAALLRAGYTRGDIEKICSGNLLRVWSAVEATARQIQQAGR